MPKWNETAELIVEGRIFRNWESIQVICTMYESPPSHFRFTCAESLPLSANWDVMQIKPGDQCTVKLAGVLVITGIVTHRQVFYDSRRHVVEIIGASWAHQAANTAAIVKGFEIKDKNYEQVAKQLLKPTGVGFRIAGGPISQAPFPRVSIMPGESIRDVLERLGRYVGVALTDDPQGNIVARRNSEDTGGLMLVEGQDIIEGKELIFNEALNTNLTVMSSSPGSDSKHGAAVSHDAHESTDSDTKFSPPAKAVVVGEMPIISDEHIKARAQHENEWQIQDAVTIIITVLGWLKKGGNQLWQQGEKIKVKSPMLIQDGTNELVTNKVVFSQDNRNGSRTVLELMNDAAQKGGITQMQPIKSAQGGHAAGPV